jgi:hypothetical protein
VTQQNREPPTDMNYENSYAEAIEIVRAKYGDGNLLFHFGNRFRP